MADIMNKFDYDYIIVGSGFGGSVSAYRLSEKGYSVLVIEQGKRWTPENLPSTNWKIWSYLWQPILGLHGFLRLRLFKHVMVLHGNAVGGGSITYAQTLLIPPDSVWNDGGWSSLDDWQNIMPAYYAMAKKMLGVTRNERGAAADEKLRQMAKAADVEDSFYYTDVGVFFGEKHDAPGTEYSDPYFGGKGPSHNSCIGCGGCFTQIAAIILGKMELNKIDAGESTEAGRTFAKTGMILGIIGALLYTLGMIAYVILMVVQSM